VGFCRTGILSQLLTPDNGNPLDTQDLADDRLAVLPSEAQ
jgi:hypothetical protein